MVRAVCEFRRGPTLTLVLVLLGPAGGCAQGTRGDGDADATDDVDAALPADADTRALTVEITAGPSSLTEATEATFAFATTGPVASITCQVDDDLAEVCTSPHTVTGVAIGPHTFTVDVAGGGDAATDAYPWEVAPGCTPMTLEAESLGSTWPVAMGMVLSGGQGLNTGVAGASFSFDFVGTSLTMFVETGPNLHVLTSIVDDDVLQQHDTTSGSFEFQQPFVISTGLLDGPHTAVITCMTPNCAPDFFEVGCD